MGFQGPALVMYKKFGFRAVEFLPQWHDLGFTKDGSFSTIVLNSLREEMVKQFETEIRKEEISACTKIGLNAKWAKHFKSLKLWEAEANSYLVLLHMFSRQEIEQMLACPINVPVSVLPSGLQGVSTGCQTFWGPPFLDTHNQFDTPGLASQPMDNILRGDPVFLESVPTQDMTRPKSFATTNKSGGRGRGRGGKGNRYVPGVVCWNCSKPGHRADVCRFT